MNHPSNVTEAPKITLDIIFVLDGSASVSWHEFVTMKEWTKTMARQFYEFDKKTQIGVIQYSTYFQ